MYKNYIFDLYGTLVDINTDEESNILWEKLSLFYTLKGAEYNSETLKNRYKELVKEKLSTIKDIEYPDFQLTEVFEKLYLDKHINPSDELIFNTAQFFRVLSIKYLKLYDGVIELLDKLKEKGKKIYLLSNAQSVFTFYEMKALGIEKYFDGICFSADYNMCKPEKGFYESLLNEYNINVSESIMIGNDYLADIIGAKSVGLDTLYIHSNLSPEVKCNIESTFSIMDKDFTKIEKIIVE